MPGCTPVTRYAVNQASEKGHTLTPQALQTDVTVYVIFVVPGTDRSLCHFEQLESTEQSIGW